MQNYISKLQYKYNMRKRLQYKFNNKITNTDTVLKNGHKFNITQRLKKQIQHYNRITNLNTTIQRDY